MVGSGEDEHPKAHSRPVGTRGAQLCVSRFSVEELDRARHQNDLCQSLEEFNARTVKVHIDTAHACVGGDVSWLPAIHPCYYVDPGTPQKPSVWTYALGVRVMAGRGG